MSATLGLPEHNTTAGVQQSARVAPNCLVQIRPSETILLNVTVVLRPRKLRPASVHEGSEPTLSDVSARGRLGRRYP